ncbi:MAG: MBOAT family protein [Turicibacter sp.]|nr:MBOAT family protein [Turicibacter sp.]
MLFNSYQFFVFFPIVLLLYFVLPSKVKYIWLLLSSYYFYMNWNPLYALLMLSSTLVTWATGLGIHRLKDKEEHKVQKLLLFLCLLFNFVILFLFKYLDFSISMINKIFGYLDMPMIEKTFNFLLPVGISFYTFQALGYLVDVYRGMTPETNVLKYALFVSFFPQLVAGPIERSKNLLDQIQKMEHWKLWSSKRIVNGLIYMLWGYFLKMTIADRVAILVDQVWDSYWAYGSIALITASIGFSIQIYCDFSSYSCIAIGAAQIMGFTLMENFDAPYFAHSVKEFWRRWHISLSTWFRDYLYIPLGGSRCSRLKRYRNLLITFLVSGLWHGAGIGYIVWGGTWHISDYRGSYTAF